MVDREPGALPDWARPHTYLVLLSATAGLLLLVAMGGTPECGPVAWVPLFLAAVPLIFAAQEWRLRGLLRRGVGRPGKIVRVERRTDLVRAWYEFESCTGKRRGRQDFTIRRMIGLCGRWPKEGDDALVVEDPRRPARHALWNVYPAQPLASAAPTGQERQGGGAVAAVFPIVVAVGLASYAYVGLSAGAELRGRPLRPDYLVPEMLWKWASVEAFLAGGALFCGLAGSRLAACRWFEHRLYHATHVHAVVFASFLWCLAIIAALVALTILGGIGHLAIE